MTDDLTIRLLAAIDLVEQDVRSWPRESGMAGRVADFVLAICAGDRRTVERYRDWQVILEASTDPNWRQVAKIRLGSYANMLRDRAEVYGAAYGVALGG